MLILNESDLTIVLVNFFTSELIAKQSLERFACKVLVVDNSCSDKEWEALSVISENYKLLRAERNGGYSYAINLAKDHIETEWVLILNPDNLLIELPKQIEDGLIGGLLGNYPGTYAFGGRGIGRPTRESIDYISGGLLMCRTEVLKNSPWPRSYFLYWEDTDWTYSLKKKGYGLYYTDELKCLDGGGKSIGRLSRLAIANFYKGLVIFNLKHKVFTKRKEISLVGNLVIAAFINRIREVIRS